MEENLKVRENIRKQIKENFGRILYTYTSHIKMAQILQKKDSVLRIFQIVLAALSGSSLFSLIFTSEKLIAILGTIIAIILVIISSLSKSFYFSERANQHVLAHNSFWEIKERYMSLITDFDVLDLKEIQKVRDQLIEKTSIINQSYPKTSKKAYELTQRALQNEEEQSFNNGELDNFLPTKDL
ncbi:MAG: SLATT domain-containing protein [Acholeplasmataceae bacterium]